MCVCVCVCVRRSTVVADNKIATHISTCSVVGPYLVQPFVKDVKVLCLPDICHLFLQCTVFVLIPTLQVLARVGHSLAKALDLMLLRHFLALL